MMELDLQPDSGKLRQFGLVCLGGFGFLGLLVAWKTGAFEEPGKWTVPVTLWVVATMAHVLGLFAPNVLKPLYQLLTLVGFPIGFIVANLLLMFVFFLLITPLALWFRIIGRDELKIRWSSKIRPSWVDVPAPRDIDSYFQQF